MPVKEKPPPTALTILALRTCREFSENVEITGLPEAMLVPTTDSKPAATASRRVRVFTKDSTERRRQPLWKLENSGNARYHLQRHGFPDVSERS
jgi:hypothetical protein